jgi:hypothetical protein
MDKPSVQRSMTQGKPGPRWRRLLGLVAVPFVTAAMFGCGASGSSHSSAESAGSPHGRFLASINGICARAVAAHAGHSFPVANFDPEHPSPDQLQAVGSYFARYGRLPQTVTALHQLHPPPPDAADWERLLAIADRMTVNSKRQIKAARAQDVTAFVQTTHTAAALGGQLDLAGRKFGFVPGSPCARQFG